MKKTHTHIVNDWRIILGNYLKKKSFLDLIRFVNTERKDHSIFPSKNEVFNAFKYCSFKNTKIIIIGQDPYHAKNQATGLAFSVNKNNKIPPSLRNIFNELESDLQIPFPIHGNLKSWADQGVLLLNSTLTVKEGEARSHSGKGWEEFTNNVISTLSEKKNNLIFLLWGTFAQKKVSLINNKKHIILKTSHPSPLSAYRGFLGCKHFSKTNNILIENKQEAIDWRLC